MAYSDLASSDLLITPLSGSLKVAIWVMMAEKQQASSSQCEGNFQLNEQAIEPSRERETVAYIFLFV